MQQVQTPMMKQYQEIKKQYQDCLLFYRMGDFYELFLEDAFVGAKVLNITLTGKSNGKNGRIPMAGVPYHAVDNYLAKLVKAGYKVAICEQVSLPTKYGLVDREVVRVVTPGTMLDEKALEKKENNFIISLYLFDKGVALSVADLSTGYFSTTQISTENYEQTIKDELSRLHPTECILPEPLYNDPEILRILKGEKSLNIFVFPAWDDFSHQASRVLKEHFQVKTLVSFGIAEETYALQTAAALLGYLKQTQKVPVAHIKKISRFSSEDALMLDRSSMINLELFSTIREHDTKGSLLSVLDHTHTAMGGRLMKQWLRKPLTDKVAIEERHEAVDFLLLHKKITEELLQPIKAIIDVERLLSRLSVGLGNARDMVNLKESLKAVLEEKKILQTTNSPLLKSLSEAISENLQELIVYIEKYLVAEPPVGVREGGMIALGIHAELDRLRKIVGGSREWIAEMEQKEREKTGISTLKIRFNKVFGFYIEVSKSHATAVPDTYFRKQTLVNGERFITQELKEQEEIILTAEEKIHEIEYTIFLDVLKKILAEVMLLQEAASAIAVLDCLLSFAYISQKYNYVKPKLLYSGELRIKDGRHPVVERLLEETPFVPNDCTLDTISQQLILLTGPNMAGKSVFIRQIALIVLMAQIGCFVPAKKAHMSIVDRIFVRSGASDVITSGLSTFMVEMVETAHILHYATKNSLIVMDEIGRGTSTYDGISIAWAVAEYLVRHTKTPPKTLFATHYHELQELENEYPKRIRNFHMAVADDKGEPIFLHTILPGGASHSFGVAVAKLAGIPEEVIERAKEILVTLEKRSTSNVVTPGNKSGVQSQERWIPDQVRDDSVRSRDISTLNIVDHLIHIELSGLDISQMTPLEALNKLAELKEKLKLFEKQNDMTAKLLEN